MRRRRLLWLIALSTALLGTVGGTLYAMFKYEPAFYRNAQIEAGSHRQRCSREFWGRSLGLFETFKGETTWAQEFTQEQINSYLQEEANKRSSSLFELPEQIADPRLDLQDDRLQVGFRYGQGPWSTVLSVDIRVWLVAKDANTIAVELCGFHAGGIPLGVHSLMEYITEAAREQSIDVTWYRHAGHPVALLRLQADQSRPTFQLRRLEASEGKIVLAGKRLQDSSAPAEPAANR